LGKKLHIISLDIPSPPDYGGVIDIFYKLKSLHTIGVEITLHCFEYGDRKPSTELQQYCTKVYYYKRLIGIRGLHPSLPYIISSRRDPALLTNLLKDDAPVLFEGVHCLYYAMDEALAGRKKILRAHNVESDYYRSLATHAGSVLKQLYYSFESNRLSFFEKSMHQYVDVILSISESDYRYFTQTYPSVKHFFIPAFHANEEVDIQVGSGHYCLYHGNLSVAENVRSARYLAETIFKHVDSKLIIAGKDPDETVIALQNDHIKVIPNPDTQTLVTLIREAHIHVLPAFQSTGLKLKLLHALFIGRHCLTNIAVSETALQETIHVADTDEEFIFQVQELIKRPFTETDIKIRKQALAFYSNIERAMDIEGFL